MRTGILGGVFDPPQVGHVALGRAALEQLPIDRLLVLVAAAPGHREVVAPADERLRLAKLAFDFADEVALDEHAFTVDAVRDGRFGDAIFIVGADEGAAFPSWKEPDVVLVMVTAFEPLAIAPRPAPPPSVGWSSAGSGPVMFSSRVQVSPPSSERNRPEPMPPYVRAPLLRL